MNSFYKQQIAISYQDIATSLASEEISEITTFLQTLVGLMKGRALSTLPGGSDVFFKTLTQGMSDTLINAEIAVKKSSNFEWVFEEPKVSDLLDLYKEAVMTATVLTGNE